MRRCILPFSLMFGTLCVAKEDRFLIQMSSVWAQSELSELTGKSPYIAYSAGYWSSQTKIPFRVRVTTVLWPERVGPSDPNLRTQVKNYSGALEYCDSFHPGAGSGFYYAIGVAADHWIVRTEDGSGGITTSTTKSSGVGAFGYLFKNGMHVEVQSKTGNFDRGRTARITALAVGVRF